MDKVRIDKWLWSVRIFKTRTLASDACKAGKVKLGGDNLKASYMVKVGETILVKKEGFNFTYKVLSLIEKRVGAPIAITCYENLTPESELKKYEAWFLDGAQAEFRERGAGRPTKRDRRDIDKYKES
jgi:ribosome-associated heat shock protein Hsp15